MKLYLTDIIKEANSLGFGAPGMGGNSSDTNMANIQSGPSMPMFQPNQQAGGMMLPQTSVGLGQPGQIGQQIMTAPQGFKPTI